MSPSDTATTSRSARHGHGHDAAFGGSNSSDARSNGTGSKQSRRLHRSLPVTTSEVASCLSRKRKMMSAAAAAAEEEESPTMTTGGQNLLLPSATAAANTSGGNTSGNTNKKTIAPSGRFRTAPAVAPFTDQTDTNKPPAVNGGDATSTAHHQSLIPRSSTGTTTSGYIGTSWGGAAMMGSMRVPIFAGSLTVPARPTKKTGVKRSRILAGGIVVDGGTGSGGGGGSAYGFAFNGSGHATNTSASSYYLYHGHRHTNDARLSPSSPRVYHDCYSTTSSRSSSSFDSFHDCLSCEEDEQNGNSHKYESILDINSAPSCCKSAKCRHRLDHNSSQSLAISFLEAYGKDYYANLRRMDNEQGERPDLGLILSVQRYLTEKDRVHAIEWMSEAALGLDLTDLTFFTSVAFLDRLAAIRHGIRDDTFHKAALACLYVAAKMIETNYEEDLRAQDFINASPHTMFMHAQDLFKLESTVCDWLDYRLYTVTPVCFLDRFLHASHPSTHYSDAMQREERCKASVWALENIGISQPRGTLESLALYFLELATHSAELAMQKPDMLAASAIYLAKATIGLHAEIDENAPPSGPPDSLFWDETLEHYTDYTAEELEDVVRVMHELHCDTNHSSEFTYVYEKFSTERYMQVSFVPPLLVNELGFL